MDAHLVRGAILVAAITSMAANYRTANFVVSAPSSSSAEQIGRAAEKYRKALAVEWLGQEMPNWSQPCPISAQVADHLGAGGATSFVFEHGEVFGWRMTIQGSQERILDSVLPHEVTHTIFATHFRQPLPRWADEGACTTVEHVSEKSKQQHMLIDFLRTGRGIAFNQMFAMKDYPHDVMPLYSQGYSVARYLVAQGGKRKFLDFLGDGLRDENWQRATNKHYGYANLAVLQSNWLDWVRKGSPQIDVATANPALVAVKASPDDRLARAEIDANEHDSARSPRAQAEPVAAGGDGVSSVYDRNSAADDRGEPATDSKPRGWRTPRDGASAIALVSSESGERPSAGRGPVASVPERSPAHQATRPQEIQRPGQVILEWSRPFQAADDERGLRVSSSYNATSMK
jgi:hypothetical protein